MKVSGKTVVPRPPGELWELLFDPALLRRCIPGCETLETDGDDTWRVRLSVGKGLLRSSFRGQVRLCEARPHESCRLELRASGLTGAVDGVSDVRLVAMSDGTSTELHYRAEAEVRGVVARTGARLLGPEDLEPYVEEFFRKLAAG